MIKRGIKNYFVCLKYFFTPLGTLFLGIIIGFSVFIPIAASAFNGMAEEINRVITEISIEPDKLFERLWICITELDWGNNASGALETMLSREWLELTLHKSINSLFGGDYTIYAQQINDAVNVAVAQIAAGVIIIALCAVASAVAGYFLVKFLIRRTIAKRALWKFLLVTLADCTAVVLLFILNVWLTALWVPSIVFSSLISFLSLGGMSLLEAYAVHAAGKVKFKEIVTLKNLGLLILTNIIICLLWFALVLIVTLILNEIAGYIIGLVLLEIAGIVIGMNAESFVKDYVEKRSEKREEVQTAEAA
ncbi:MAG: hypothetical protein K2L42_05365 [Clostridia bacterium]|nr:hypothetical protein [Clostridia bacterium]